MQKTKEKEKSKHVMEYATSLPGIIIPEYGRNVQMMIEHAMTIANKEERNKAAQTIIMVMAQVNPLLKEMVDYKHKLWDHLFIISNFKLDVDSPYPKPEKEALAAKPKKLNYPAGDIKKRYYGRTVEALIVKGMEMKDGEEKDALAENIANVMKRFYLNWNRDTVTDDIIIKELDIMSGGKLKLKDNVILISSGSLITKPPVVQSNNNKRRNNNNRNQRNNSGGGGGYRNNNNNNGRRNSR